MGKMIKWLFFGIIALLVLLAIAVFIALQSIDTKTVKTLVEEQTKLYTSLDMNFKGELKWSIFPSARLTVGEIELHTEDAYDGNTLFASIGSATASVQLRPLLKGSVNVEQLALDNVKLRMVTDKRGYSNWKDIEPQEGIVEQADGAEESTSPSDAESESIQILFSNVEMRDIGVDIVDLPSNTRQALKLRSFDGNDINFNGNPFGVKSSLEFTNVSDNSSYTLDFASPFRFDSEKQQFAIDNLKGKFDQTDFSGTAFILLGKDTEFNAQLAMGTLDLNRYISSDSSDEETQASEVSSPEEDIEIPLDFLHTLNTDLAVTINKLIYDKTELDNATLDMSIDNGLLNMRKLDAEVFGGKISQSFTINAKRSPASFEARQNMQNIDLASMFNSNDIEVGLEGKANLTTNVTAKGNSSNALKRTLSGNTVFKLAQGRYLDDNFEQRICQSIALARQTALTSQFSTGTNLNDVNVAIDWNNGLGTIKSLNAGLANATLTGDGKINLIDTSYDMRMQANVSGNLNQAEQDTGCEINENYRNIQWPIRCQGNAAENSCGVDNSRLDKILANAVKARAKAAVDKEVDKQKAKLQEKINEKLGDEVGNALKGLFR